MVIREVAEKLKGTDNGCNSKVSRQTNLKDIKQISRQLQIQAKLVHYDTPSFE